MYSALGFACSAALFSQSLAGAVLPRQDSADTDAFKQLDNAYNTMQSTYFDGKTWDISLQWEQAVMGTLQAATLESYTEALQKYNGVPTDDKTLSVDEGKALVEAQYSDLLSYYSQGEQVEEIYGEAYDDVQWVVLEWLQAIRMVNEYKNYVGGSWHGTDDIASFAHRAHQFYNRITDKFDTAQCDGGLTWNPTLATYKNAITNQLFVSSSVSMYLYFPGDSNTDPYSSTPPSGDQRPPLSPIGAQDSSFLDNAKKGYEWIMTHNFTNAQGLYTDGFHISDGQSTCDQRDEMVYTYNQGVILSGMRGLWEATGETSYLDDGYTLIKNVIAATGEGSGNSDFAGLGRGGVMEDLCDADASCSADSQAFKGIFFHHLTLFCEALPTAAALVPGKTFTADAATASTHADTCRGYSSWVTKNAAAAFKTRDAQGIFGGWWNAPDASSSSAQGLNAVPPVPLPAGAQDYRNHPELLTQAPWAKGSGGNSKRRTNLGLKERADDTGRSSQTQMSGLGVSRAGWQFLEL